MIETLCGGSPFFIIDHPARLLRQPELKARDWQMLKQLKHALAQGRRQLKQAARGGRIATASQYLTESTK